MGDFGSTVDACPFCGAIFPIEELNVHANTHFDSAPASPSPEATFHDDAAAVSNTVVLDVALVKASTSNGLTTESKTNPRNGRTSKNGRQERLEHLPADPLTLSAVQTMDPRFEVHLDSLLRLEDAHRAARDSPNATSVLCRAGPVQHFCATAEDRGWGCGYRNCQMLVSHLLSRGQLFHQALFGGAGYVPDIVSLQAWLECAWGRGFDPEGKHMLEGSVQGSDKWVGAVDIAALLRQFGVQATVVDFIGKHSMHHPSYEGGTVHRGIVCDFCRTRPIIGLRFASQSQDQFDLCEHCMQSDEASLHGPFTTHGRKETHQGMECISCGVQPIVGVRYQQKGGRSRLCQECYLSKTEMEQSLYKPFYKSKGVNAQDSAHEQMMQWIWNYFTEGVEMDQENSRQFISTGKAPLYLQHAGHSRTVVGIERVISTGRNGGLHYSLIIFDPGTWSSSIQRNLERGVGWQRLLKRGLHTLGHPEYQILYIQDQIVPPGALNSLKSISIAECIYA